MRPGHIINDPFPLLRTSGGEGFLFCRQPMGTSYSLRRTRPARTFRSCPLSVTRIKSAMKCPFRNAIWLRIHVTLTRQLLIVARSCAATFGSPFSLVPSAPPPLANDISPCQNVKALCSRSASFVLGVSLLWRSHWINLKLSSSRAV